MNKTDKKLAFKIYLYLGALFITSLVVSNLIFQKFFIWQPFGDVTIFSATLFEISVGVLPYPVTFLLTDLISEIYGKKNANQIVVAGIFASFFSLLIVYLASSAQATSWSSVNNAMFKDVFGNTILAVTASMLAYLFAQFVDIQVYHFWKKLTQGKHLWLRNNFSTFFSQLVDTGTVLLLLCSFGEIAWDKFTGLLISGFIFKIIIAFVDTPFLYLFVYIMRKRFNLKINQEITLES
ncbi:queuosine precursor transporter [Cellulophaga omnivescoria]|uniref:queuosine precursor transporter n=1 Tax=Cellulophaga omnivescoria TaxID=1888890 RepID=UPI0022F106EC|nr:queuosine precursor transporter [Cellulophaga omnivescoria]WBU88122.1 queuosine precursor transporter [Cellulophaga omnivescoria]